MPYLSIRAVETRRADTQIFVDACSTFECCVSDCVIASEAGGVPSTSQLGQGRTIVTRSATGPVQTINHGGSTDFYPLSGLATVRRSSTSACSTAGPHNSTARPSRQFATHPLGLLGYALPLS